MGSYWRRQRSLDGRELMSESKPYVRNAANPEQVKNAEMLERHRVDSEIRDMAVVLNSPEGRRLVWRYLEFCSVFKSTFNHSGSISAFNEGMRNVGLKLMAELNEASPEAYLIMLKESKEKR